MLKKSISCFALIGIVALALASSGGGGKKKSKSSIGSEFSPIRTSSGFTLKAGPQYTGSQTFSSQHNANFVLFNTVVTYQKGNSIYILPYQYKMTTRKIRSNANVLDLKIRLHK